MYAGTSLFGSLICVALVLVHSPWRWFRSVPCTKNASVVNAPHQGCLLAVHQPQNPAQGQKMLHVPWVSASRQHKHGEMEWLYNVGCLLHVSWVTQLIRNTHQTGQFAKLHKNHQISLIAFTDASAWRLDRRIIQSVRHLDHIAPES